MSRLLALLFAALLSACEQQPKEFNHSILSFGTIIDITLYDVDEKLAEEAFASLDKDFEYFHAAWSPWRR